MKRKPKQTAAPIERQLLSAIDAGPGMTPLQAINEFAELYFTNNAPEVFNVQGTDWGKCTFELADHASTYAIEYAAVNYAKQTPAQYLIYRLQS